MLERSQEQQGSVKGQRLTGGVATNLGEFVFFLNLKMIVSKYYDSPLETKKMACAIETAPPAEGIL